uniref:Uncharacterized protein n=1 Tax=Rhodnius prolixus TaxID=13249 RepID=T1H7Q0_RHOPR
MLAFITILGTLAIVACQEDCVQKIQINSWDTNCDKQKYINYLITLHYNLQGTKNSVCFKWLVCEVLHLVDLSNTASESNLKETKEFQPTITYGIDDVPPWYLSIFLALQHYLTMIGAIVAIPFILTPALCMEDDDPARGHIISTMIFVTGIVTYIQVTFGCRLPIVQGGTICFLVPTLAILNLPRWKCPEEEIMNGLSAENKTEMWQSRMRELSGAIAISALVQVFIGFCGIMGIILKYVTPLTIVPTVSLVLLTIIIMWGISGLLTLFDALPPGHPGRTDVKLKILELSDWFRVPYPGQWGAPTISIAGVLGMLAGVLACTVESISYYPTVIGSRRVIQYACILMILQGVINKFGALFIIIPQPVVGGIFCVMFGMIAAFGLSALQYVELNSSRNLYIIGFSMFFSLVLPKWMQANPNAIQTGSEVADSVLTVLLSTSILVGGLLGCLLDNLIPGSDEERGIIAWKKQMVLKSDPVLSEQEESTYDFPIGMELLKKQFYFA